MGDVFFQPKGRVEIGLHIPPNTEPGQRKIVPHRVFRCYFSKDTGNFQGGLEVSALSFGEIEPAAYPVHVGIQGDNQLRRRYLFPSPGVHTVFPYHPAQKEVQPFACAAMAREG